MCLCQSSVNFKHFKSTNGLLDISFLICNSSESYFMGAHTFLNSCYMTELLANCKIILEAVIIFCQSNSLKRKKKTLNLPHPKIDVKMTHGIIPIPHTACKTQPEFSTEWNCLKNFVRIIPVKFGDILSCGLGDVV